jgi:hypothetical protein
MRSRGHQRRPRPDVSRDPPVPRLNELNNAFAVREVRIERSRQRRAREVLERHGESDRGSALVYEVLQEDEIQLPPSAHALTVGAVTVRHDRDLAVEDPTGQIMLPPWIGVSGEISCVHGPCLASAA